MYLGKADVNTYDKGAEREFLVTSRNGSYGFSTVVGANTRSEHGMFAVRRPGSERHTILVSKLEETLYALNKKYQLSTNRYKDLVFPDGFRYVQEYQGSPYPTFTFVVHSIFLKKSVIMPQDGDCTIVRYELTASPEEISLDIRPLFAHRNSTDLVSSSKKPEFTSDKHDDGSLTVHGRGISSCVACRAVHGVSFEWLTKPMWFEDIVYAKSGTPEDPKTDCLWSPGHASLKMKEGDVVYFILSREPISLTITDVERIEHEEAERLSSLIHSVDADARHTIVRELVQGASHLVADGSGDTAPLIFSGFPSVEQRSRDTFIALPGLTISMGKTDTAKAILEHWLDRSKTCGHVIPSYIDHEGMPKTGDIDAGLWFLYAFDKYSTETSFDLAKERFADIAAVADRYIAGSDGLGAVMDEATALIKYTDSDKTKHWMSGDVLGEPLVSRKGYLVEIEALWYNALVFMSEAAKAANNSDAEKKYSDLSERVADSFVKTFVNSGNGYLYDWVDVDNDTHDDAIRPNALLAVSLPHPVLTGDAAKKVFSVCWNELYTTYGLRTLDPHHDKFKGRSEGRDDQKKKARLRGMAWPWLLGQFVTAYKRFNPEKLEVAWSFLRPFASHLRRGCLSGVAEYFDGMMPYLPNGDVLSAVSQGEMLRVIHEDLLKKG